MLYEVKDDIAWIKLNRLERHNAINFEMVEKIYNYLEKAEKTDGVVAVVLTSNGKTFCAGLDSVFPILTFN
ncbi:MAG: enoyl-CoA hydratase/isomerase family protein [Candidatus Njordarchaeia archaeon]